MISLHQQTKWVGHAQWVIASFTLCGLVAFFLTSYQPGTESLAELRKQIAGADLQMQKNDDMAKDLPAIKRDLQRLRDQITRSRQLPKKQELPQFLRDVTQLSQAAGLQGFRYEPQTQKKQELCYELPITLTFQGKFPAVASFLRSAEEMQRLTRTRRLELKCKDIKNGNVDVDLSMNIYFADGQ